MSDDGRHDPSHVTKVLAQFAAGLAAPLSDLDAATHFELGVAYREMGLVADAIGAIEAALHAESGHVQARAALLELRPARRSAGIG